MDQTVFDFLNLANKKSNKQLQSVPNDLELVYQHN